jgi:hypothetical protein
VILFKKQLPENEVCPPQCQANHGDAKLEGHHRKAILDSSPAKFIMRVRFYSENLQIKL